ncbi:hypothetical protein ABK040_003265 [Willaertia magna]
MSTDNNIEKEEVVLREIPQQSTNSSSSNRLSMKETNNSNKHTENKDYIVTIVDTSKEHHSVKSTVHNNRRFKGFVIRTKWGDFELTKTVCMSLLALFVTIIGFLAIFVFVFVNFFYNSERTKLTRFIFKMSDLSQSFSISRELVEQVIAFSSENDHVKLLNERFNTSSNSFKNLLNSIYADSKNITTIPFDRESYLKLGTNVYTMQTTIFDNIVANRNSSDFAQMIYYSINYSSNLTAFDSLNSELKQAVIDREDKVSFLVSYISGFALCIVVADIVIILPIIVFNVILSINTDRHYRQRLRQANTLMLTDTMRNTRIRQLFKDYCQQERSIENFLFLERVYEYVTIAEHCEFIRCELFKSQKIKDVNLSNELMLENISTETSCSSSELIINENNNATNNNTINTIIQDKKKKQRAKKNFTQDDLKEYENKKYSEAFQIYTDFLELEGQYAINVNKKGIERVKLILDQFNLKQIESLPILLFEDLEQEIAYLLIDTHKRFKQSSLFKEAMKINRKP